MGEAEDLDARVRDLLRRGDAEAAATDAFRALGPGVLRYLRSLLRDADAAEEAFSTWGERFWSGLPAFRFEGALRTWALRLAYHAALNLRDEAWNRHRARLATSAASRLAAEVRTRTAVRVERQRQALDVLREALTIDERALLTLRVDQGLPWAEIADVLAAGGEEVDPGALMKRFERLKARLARLAREEGLIE